MKTYKPIHRSQWESEENNKAQLLYAVSYSPDGLFFAAGGSNGEARLYNSNTFEPLDYVSLGKSPVYSLAFNNSSNQLAVVGGANTFKVLNIV